MARKIWLLQRFAFLVGCFLIVRWLLLYIPQSPTVIKVSYKIHPRDSNSNAIHNLSSVTQLPIGSPMSSVRARPKMPTRYQNITIAAVACGDRANETLVMMKSALLLSEYSLKFIVFCDEEATFVVKEEYDKWPPTYKRKCHLDIRPITFPSQGAEGEWKKLFKPCASQRLFLPSLLNDVDALLYVDTDTIFLAPPEQIWHHFSLMSNVHIAALAPEHEDPATGWYNRFARHPYFEPLGVNSGVMLMNLTRMRQFNWQEYIHPIYQEYKLKITWGDQDIINIMFHFHPETLYVYPCSYNYRPDHCMYMSVCKVAEEEGIYVLHGNRRSFHNKKQPTFRAVYKVFCKVTSQENKFLLRKRIPNSSVRYQFAWENGMVSSSVKSRLLEELKEALEPTSNTNCGKIRQVFYMNIGRLGEA